MAVSTGGRSPLGAQKIRDLAEPLFRDLVGQAMVLQIRLQELMRTEAKEVLDSPGDRQRFLETVWNHEAIGDLLRQGQWEEAAALAREILHKTRPPS
ncbi:MAG: bifunctional precorrin-2 dehydrogenase/sirohydrochlorin ferrochelatase, partial [Nitrospinaceae bacterium]|nr:bifunctional precorrin-2 dehydrogenase/sirohydrochlorin ferrochelatase [Nitrospinaceae bacterium]